MTVLSMSKAERKKCVKNIEKHLRNYKNYKIGIKNLEKQLSLISSKTTPLYPTLRSFAVPSVLKIKAELEVLLMIVGTIERALAELTEIEKKYVECRYFNKWSVNKSAMEIGYSDKALFAIRNQVMDKFLISMGSLIYMEQA